MTTRSLCERASHDINFRQISFLASNFINSNDSTRALLFSKCLLPAKIRIMSISFSTIQLSYLHPASHRFDRFREPEIEKIALKFDIFQTIARIPTNTHKILTNLPQNASELLNLHRRRWIFGFIFSLKIWCLINVRIIAQDLSHIFNANILLQSGPNIFQVFFRAEQLIPVRFIVFFLQLLFESSVKSELQGLDNDSNPSLEANTYRSRIKWMKACSTSGCISALFGLVSLRRSTNFLKTKLF